MRQQAGRLAARVLFVLGLAAAAAAAQAQSFTATLLGPNENPPNNSTGTGSTTVTINSVAHTMRVQVTFQGLSSNTTASHIHCCIAPPGATGIATTTPSFVGF